MDRPMSTKLNEPFQQQSNYNQTNLNQTNLNQSNFNQPNFNQFDQAFKPIALPNTQQVSQPFVAMDERENMFNNQTINKSQTDIKHKLEEINKNRMSEVPNMMNQRPPTPDFLKPVNTNPNKIENNQYSNTSNQYSNTSNQYSNTSNQYSNTSNQYSNGIQDLNTNVTSFHGLSNDSGDDLYSLGNFDKPLIVNEIVEDESSFEDRLKKLQNDRNKLGPIQQNQNEINMLGLQPSSNQQQQSFNQPQLQRQLPQQQLQMQMPQQQLQMQMPQQQLQMQMPQQQLPQQQLPQFNFNQQQMQIPQQQLQIPQQQLQIPQQQMQIPQQQQMQIPQQQQMQIPQQQIQMPQQQQMQMPQQQQMPQINFNHQQQPHQIQPKNQLQSQQLQSQQLDNNYSIINQQSRVSTSDLYNDVMNINSSSIYYQQLVEKLQKENEELKNNNDSKLFKLKEQVQQEYELLRTKQEEVNNKLLLLNNKEIEIKQLVETYNNISKIQYLQLEISNENNSEYTYNLGIPIKNVLGIKLVSYTIPEPKYNIENNKNNLLLVKVDDVTYNIELNNGLYNIELLINEINRLLENNKLNISVKTTLDQKVLFVSENNFDLLPTTLLINNLGYSNAEYSNNKEYKSTKVWDLRLDNKVYLYLDNLSDNPFGVLYFNNLSNTNLQFKFDKPFMLNKLDIKLLDSKGMKYEMNNLPHVLSFVVEHI
jgi:hypothetical protein